MQAKSFLGNRWVRALVAAGLLSLSSLGHAGLVFSEPATDAGATFATATTVSGSGALSAIRGETTASDLVDIFAIYLDAGANFRATTTESGVAYNFFDTSLFLFDVSGLAVAENDDDPMVGPQSTLTFTSGAAGVYYLAITGTGNAYGGGMPGWTDATSENGAYEIVMTGASAVPPTGGDLPEPSSWALAALALGGAGWARQRRRA